MRFKDSFKSYLLVIGLGLLAGIITTLLNLFPNDTLWSLSSIASVFGFWMITVTLIVYFSSSNKNASINVFLYLASMNFNFYFLQGVLGLFLPRFHNVENFINWGLLNKYNALALVCAIVSFVLYYWNKNNKISSVLYALPICGLGSETIGVIFYLVVAHTYLFQVFLDCLGLALLICLFYKKTNNKLIFISTAILGSIIGSCIFYIPFL
ncbi:MAG: hypothetical protein Q8942_12725 [Bacillota bacterium]|nr:hypothetical protein [Bacillota bacterium]